MSARAVAVAMVRVLAKNGNELYAHTLRDELLLDIGYVPDDRVIMLAAKWLRNKGVPLVTRPARHRSKWLLAPPGSAAYGEWVDWILNRHYQETVSAYRALANDPSLASQKGVLYRSAMDAGFLLGKDALQINTTLTAPATIPPDVVAAMHP